MQRAYVGEQGPPSRSPTVSSRSNLYPRRRPLNRWPPDCNSTTAACIPSAGHRIRSICLLSRYLSLQQQYCRTVVHELHATANLVLETPRHCIDHHHSCVESSFLRCSPELFRNAQYMSAYICVSKKLKCCFLDTLLYYHQSAKSCVVSWKLQTHHQED